MALAHNIEELSPTERRAPRSTLPLWFRRELEANGGLPGEPYTTMLRDGDEVVQWMPDGEVVSL